MKTTTPMNSTTATVLNLDDQISAGITVRGSGMTKERALPLASPRLDQWQASLVGRLPGGATFESADEFSSKPEGEYLATRTLKVVKDENTN